MVTKEAPRCLDSFALKWQKKARKGKGAKRAPMKTSTVRSLGTRVVQREKLRSGLICRSRGHESEGPRRTGLEEAWKVCQSSCTAKPWASPAAFLPKSQAPPALALLTSTAHITAPKHQGPPAHVSACQRALPSSIWKPASPFLPPTGPMSTTPPPPPAARPQRTSPVLAPRDGPSSPEKCPNSPAAVKPSQQV